MNRGDGESGNSPAVPSNNKSIEMKKYSSKTDLGLSVVLSSGASVRVCFSPLTNGGSVFYTSDKELQAALERHYKFGKSFKLEAELPDPGSEQTTVKEDKPKKGKKKQEPVEMSFSNPQAAKEYLADHFGLNRTKLKNKDIIAQVALANGIIVKYDGE